MRRVITTAVALAATATLTTGLTTVTTAGALAGPGADRVVAGGQRDAGYLMRASGFGTRVFGGSLPAGSHQTAFTALGCGTTTGVHRENHELNADLAGLGSASAVRTELWTERADGGVHTYSESRIAKVVLGQPGVGAIEIDAIDSLSHAWHDARGFHAGTRTTIGGITVTGPDGTPQPQELPTVDQPLEIPGLVKIELGRSKKQVDGAGATAIADTLDITLEATGTKIRVAHSVAQVLDGVKHGIFHGFSAGTRVSAADDTVTSGRTPLSLMPCQGTGGVVRTKAIADVDLGDQVVVQGVRSRQRGTQLRGRSVAMEQGSVAEIDLGGGQLVVRGVIGQANVTRTARGKVTSTAAGTTVAAILVNGEKQELPLTDPIEVPGLAKIQPRVVTRTRTGITVVALRITLLDGTGAKIDLGVAQAAIRPRPKG